MILNLIIKIINEGFNQLLKSEIFYFNTNRLYVSILITSILLLYLFMVIYIFTNLFIATKLYPLIYLQIFIIQSFKLHQVKK